MAIRPGAKKVKKGNPKNITSVADISNNDVEFVNRQLGSGTRILLDYELNSKGINPKDIQGYERQEITHLGVSATVESGLADVGLGLLSAAKAFDLEFIPVTQEKFDLIIPEHYYNSSFMGPLLKLIKSDEYKNDIIALGGYDTKEPGEANYITA